METLRELLKKKKIKQSVVAEALGINVNHIGRYDDLNKRSLEEVLKIEEVTGIPFEMLIGKQVVGGLSNLQNQSDVKYIAPYLGEDLVNVEYVPSRAYASFIESLYNVGYDLDTYGVRPEDGEDLNNGRYKVFDIEGDSMYPTIHSGSKILCEKINDNNWEYAKGVIVIVYGKTLTIKRILKNDLYISNTLTLKADNPTYGEIDIERCEIRGIWQATRVISMKIV